MNKKYLMIGVVLLAICVSISAVSADDSWSFNFGSSSESNSNGGDVSIDNNKVKIQGFEFTIPDGYTENESARLVGNDTNATFGTGYKMSEVDFNNGNKTIMIKVVYGDEPLNESSVTPNENLVQKKIADIQGNFGQDDDGVVLFNYVKDGKFVELVAPDEQTLVSLFK